LFIFLKTVDTDITISLLRIYKKKEGVKNTLQAISITPD